MRIYLDASAAAKLLIEEAESATLAARLDAWAEAGETLLSSLLLETDLRCLATRVGLAQASVSDLLDRLDLVEPDAMTFRAAGLLPGPHVRSLDALHVVAALQTDCRVMLSYDARQADAARTAGLAVEAPGAG